MSKSTFGDEQVDWGFNDATTTPAPAPTPSTPPTGPVTTSRAPAAAPVSRVPLAARPAAPTPPAAPSAKPTTAGGLPTRAPSRQPTAPVPGSAPAPTPAPVPEPAQPAQPVPVFTAPAPAPATPVRPPAEPLVDPEPHFETAPVAAAVTPTPAPVTPTIPSTPRTPAPVPPTLATPVAVPSSTDVDPDATRGKGKDRAAKKGKTSAKGAPQKKGSLLEAGRGGRWKVLTVRYSVYTIGALLLLGGAKNVITSDPDVSIPTLSAAIEKKSGTKGFPVAGGASFAARFAAAYLTLDPDNLEARDRLLATFAREAPGGDYGVAVSRAQGIKVGPLVADQEFTDAHNATITVGAYLSTNKWVYLAVPVYAADASTFVVSGAPGFVAQPALAVAPPIEVDVEYDTALADTLSVDLFAGFFEAWSRSDVIALGRYTTEKPDVSAMTGLGGALSFGEVAGAQVPATGGDDREAIVEVLWRSGTGEYPQKYRVDVHRDAEGRWSVQGVRGGVAATSGTDSSVNDPAAEQPVG